MSVTGQHKVYTGTIASGASISNEIDLGRTYRTVYLDSDGLGANASIYISHAASGSSGTYNQLYHPNVNTSTAQAPNAFVITSALSGGVVPLPDGIRFLKVAVTATAANGANFRLICSD